MTRRKGLTDRQIWEIYSNYRAPNLPDLDSSTNLTCFTFYITFSHHWVGISTIYIGI